MATADMELGTAYIARGAAAKPSFEEHDGAREIAGFWGYLLQIIYQVRETSTPPNCFKYYPLDNLFTFLIGEGHLNSALTFADWVLHTWRGSSFAFQVQLLVPGSYHDALTTKALLVYMLMDWILFLNLCLVTPPWPVAAPT